MSFASNLKARGAAPPTLCSMLLTLGHVAVSRKFIHAFRDQRIEKL